MFSKADARIFLEEDLHPLFLQNIKVHYKIEDSIRGSGCFQEILPRTYVIYNFYIHPQDRNQGHGQELLRYICEQAQKRGASRIFVQPGPFELDKVLSPEDKDQLLEKLFVFYEKEAFQPASDFLKSIAGILYPLIGIHENPDHLLLRIYQ